MRSVIDIKTMLNIQTSKKHCNAKAPNTYTLKSAHIKLTYRRKQISLFENYSATSSLKSSMCSKPIYAEWNWLQHKRTQNQRCINSCKVIHWKSVQFVTKQERHLVIEYINCGINLLACAYRIDGCAQKFNSHIYGDMTC